jgi:hypothetical protein
MREIEPLVLVSLSTAESRVTDFRRQSNYRLPEHPRGMVFNIIKLLL